MNLSLSLIVIFGAVIATYAEAQYGYPYPYGYGPQGGHYPYNYPAPVPYGQPHPNFFRAGYPQPSIENSNENAADTRLFFGTVTVTLATTTSTSTIISSTTCTTSARAISICSPSGRRRRGLGLNTSQKARGLFYNDEEEESETGSIFTRSEWVFESSCNIYSSLNGKIALTFINSLVNPSSPPSPQLKMRNVSPVPLLSRFLSSFSPDLMPQKASEVVVFMLHSVHPPASQPRLALTLLFWLPHARAPRASALALAPANKFRCFLGPYCFQGRL